MASQTLAHYGGVLPPSLLLSSEGSSPSEESTSSKDLLTESAGESVASSRAGREGKAVLAFVGNSQAISAEIVAQGCSNASGCFYWEHS